MSNETAAKRTPRPRLKKWLKRSGLGLLIVLVCAGAVALVASTFGAVSGQEFSPDDFSRRNFHYMEIPVLRIKVSPIYRNWSTGQLEKHLLKRKYVLKNKVKKSQQRWDLVFRTRGGIGAGEGDAKILCDYMDLASAENELLWLKWTKAHPQLAKVLWPAVAEAARRELYLFIPDLIELSKSAADPKQFQHELDVALSRNYRVFAENQQALGNHKAAIELLNAVLARRPQDARALSARAKSYQALGQRQRAAKDRAAAKALAKQRAT